MSCRATNVARCSPVSARWSGRCPRRSSPAPSSGCGRRAPSMHQVALVTEAVLAGDATWRASGELAAIRGLTAQSGFTVLVDRRRGQRGRQIAPTSPPRALLRSWHDPTRHPTQPGASCTGTSPPQAALLAPRRPPSGRCGAGAPRPPPARRGAAPPGARRRRARRGPQRGRTLDHARGVHSREPAAHAPPAGQGRATGCECGRRPGLLAASRRAAPPPASPASPMSPASPARYAAGVLRARRRRLLPPAAAPRRAVSSATGLGGV